jgi:hypothetical protein
MAKVEKYICNICGAERKEANHWFVAQLGEDFLRLMHWPEAPESFHLHMCGQVCAHKLLDQFLSGELK